MVRRRGGGSSTGEFIIIVTTTTISEYQGTRHTDFVAAQIESFESDFPDY
jgi:hypothetical protein